MERAAERLVEGGVHAHVVVSLRRPKSLAPGACRRERRTIGIQRTRKLSRFAASASEPLMRGRSAPRDLRLRGQLAARVALVDSLTLRPADSGPGSGL